MKYSRFLSISLALPLLFIACSGNDGPTDPDDGPAVLRGRVVDSSSPEEGLAGMTVVIEETGQTAVTGADGAFLFEGVEGGDLTITVIPAGGADYQGNRVDVSVHGGETVVDVTVLPGDAVVDHLSIYPASARVGILESVRFFVAGAWAADDASPEEIGYRPSWSIRSDKPIGVISREGIFIGTATGRGSRPSRRARMASRATRGRTSSPGAASFSLCMGVLRLRIIPQAGYRTHRTVVEKNINVCERGANDTVPVPGPAPRRPAGPGERSTTVVPTDSCCSCSRWRPLPSRSRPGT